MAVVFGTIDGIAEVQIREKTQKLLTFLIINYE
jgi:hypothetical protein